MAELNEDARRRHTDLVAWVADYAAKEYDDQWKTFTALDSKAQGTAAVGGVLIAALLTLSGRDTFGQLAHARGLCLVIPLLLSVLFVFLSLVLALVSLFVRRMEKPYDTKAVLAILDDVSGLPSEETNEGTISTFYREVIGHSKDLLGSMEPILDRKANGLRWAQAFLFAALILALVVLGEVTVAQVT